MSIQSGAIITFNNNSATSNTATSGVFFAPAGSTIVVAVAFSNPAVNNTSRATDTLGNTYTLRFAGPSILLFTAVSVGGANPALTITLNVNSAFAVCVDAYTGVAVIGDASSLVYAPGAITSSTPIVGTPLNTNIGDVVVSAVTGIAVPGTVTATPPTTTRVTNSTNTSGLVSPLYLMDILARNPGPITTSATMGVLASSGGMVVSLRLASNTPITPIVSIPITTDPAAASLTTFTFAVSQGDTIVLMFTYTGTLGAVTVTDLIGNTYVQQQLVSSPNVAIYTVLASIAANANNTITISNSNTTQFTGGVQTYIGVTRIGQSNSRNYATLTSGTTMTNTPITSFQTDVVLANFSVNNGAAVTVMNIPSPSQNRGGGISPGAAFVTLADNIATANGPLNASAIVTLTSSTSGSVGAVQLIPPVVLLPSTFTNGVAGTPYQATTGAFGGAPPYTPAVSSGNLPPGLSLTSAPGGILLSGIPTTAGTFNFSVTVTDQLGQTASEAFTVHIAIGIFPTVPNGTIVGIVYDQTMSATGGTAPYTTTIISGSLPPGITLGAANSNGVRLDGVPTQAGSFPLTVSVTDSAGQSGTQNLTMEVTAVSWTYPVSSQPPATNVPLAFDGANIVPATGVAQVFASGQIVVSALNIPANQAAPVNAAIPGLLLTDVAIVTASNLTSTPDNPPMATAYIFSAGFLTVEVANISTSAIVVNGNINWKIIR